MTRQNNDDTLNVLKDIIEKYSPKNLLDLGCGDAAYHNSLLFYTNCTGMDIYPLPEDSFTGEIINFIQHNLEVYPYPTQTKFDLVISLDVLEHLYDPDLFINNINNLTDNLLFLSVPNIDTIDDKLNNINLAVYDPGLKEKSSSRWTEEHIRFFNIPSLIKLLNRNNFDILEIYGTNYGASLFGTLITDKLLEKFNISPEDSIRTLGEAIIQFAPNISILAKKRI